MEALSVYLLKLSISLTFVYIFYSLFLRPLTFYKWNRYFLLIYSFIAFLIPLFNIGPGLESTKINRQEWVKIIPVIEQIGKVKLLPAVTRNNAGSDNWSVFEMLMFVFIAGVIVMLVRLVIQYLSLIRIKRSSVLLSDSDLKIYNVNRPIMPFSFGNSIFINNKIHNEAELKEIIRHEFIHVKQKHTFDIVWSEIICVLNWYNPFVWLIRGCIKQNLEFIADEKVISSGIDKKHYQYLLLKVTGVPSFGMGNNFNFSSLKKRIVMMNKSRSARLNLVKFIFVLPFIAIMLLAFRNVKPRSDKDSRFLTHAGIVINEYDQPLAGIQITDKISGRSSVTDNKGYFKIEYPVSGKSLRVNNEIRLPNENFALKSNFSIEDFARSGYLHLKIYKMIKKSDAKEPYILQSINYAKINEPDLSYSVVKQLYLKHLDENRKLKKLDEVRKGSQKPILIVDYMPYAVMERGCAWFDENEIESPLDFMVVINDSVILSMEETNAKYTIKDFTGIGESPKQLSVKKYGIDKNFFTFYTPDWLEPRRFIIPDTIAKPLIKSGTKLPVRSETQTMSSGQTASNVSVSATSGTAGSSSVNTTSATAGSSSASSKSGSAGSPSVTTVSATGGSTSASSKSAATTLATASTTQSTTISGSSSAASADADTPPVSVTSAAAGSTSVSGGNPTSAINRSPEKKNEIVLQILNTNTEKDLRKLQETLRSKGLTFNFSDLKTERGEIISLRGTLSNDKNNCSFSTNKFKNIKIYSVTNNDGSEALDVRISTSAAPTKI